MARGISMGWRTAKKPRRCDGGFIGCAVTIQPGTRYLRSVGWDEDRSNDGGKTWGAFITDCRCQPCAEMSTPLPEGLTL